MNEQEREPRTKEHLIGMLALETRKRNALMQIIDFEGEASPKMLVAPQGSLDLSGDGGPARVSSLMDLGLSREMAAHLLGRAAAAECTKTIEFLHRELVTVHQCPAQQITDGVAAILQELQDQYGLIGDIVKEAR